MPPRWIAVLLACVVVWTAGPAAAAPAGSVARIETRAGYDALARTSDVGRYFSVPQLLFVIDRARGGKDDGGSLGRLHFLNSRRFTYHIDFVQQAYLSTQSVEQLVEASYDKDDRRFVFGSVVYYPRLARYGVELWEGDTLPLPLLKRTMAQVQAAFFAPLAFKPNSQAQYALTEGQPGFPVIDGTAAYGARDSLILNAGKTVGRLRVAREVTPDLDLRPGDILMVDEAPLTLEPVAGVISTSFSTPLSHVNLLAKSWRIPNVYLSGARETYGRLDGRQVLLEARGGKVTVREATPAEVKAASARAAVRAVRLPAADLSYVGLPALSEQRAGDSRRTGAKAANLGEVASRIVRRDGDDFSVPPGFSIPFSAYAAFVKANGLDARIAAILADPRLKEDRAARHAALADLRDAFARGRVDPALLKAISARRAEVIGTGGVFVRSSTNSEDLAGFNGAGLYTSVPNVITEAQLADAIRVVWGSVWNDRAYEAREAAGIDHRGVAAAVLVQRGMDATAAGVMITENPFDPDDPDAVFINAKRGLGIRVVEGKRVAEQLIFRRNFGESIQVLTRSTDDAMLSFDEGGGVKESPVEPGRAVLTDDIAARLARVGQRIARGFGGKAQDIEWLIVGDQIHIVQTRPYFRGD